MAHQQFRTEQCLLVAISAYLFVMTLEQWILKDVIGSQAVRYCNDSDHE